MNLTYNSVYYDIKKIFIVLIFTLSVSYLYSQDCTDYHINKGHWTDDSYLYSRQSKSALFVQGMTSEFVITVYGGEDYYVAVNSHRKLGTTRIRIKEDTEDKNVLYDNAQFDYENFFFFRNENTRNLIIEVSSLAEEEFSNSSKRYCLGVLIQFRTYRDKQTKTGF